MIKMTTNFGDIEIELFPNEAPQTAANFLKYVDEGFFDGLIFHRVIPGFVIQGGHWVAKHFEVYGRFDMTIPDSDRDVLDEDFRTLTAGLNFYPFPETDNVKFSLEGLYMFDAESESIVEPNELASVRAAADDQFVLRLSFALSF